MGVCVCVRVCGCVCTCVRVFGMMDIFRMMASRSFRVRACELAHGRDFWNHFEMDIIYIHACRHVRKITNTETPHIHARTPVSQSIKTSSTHFALAPFTATSRTSHAATFSITAECSFRESPNCPRARPGSQYINKYTYKSNTHANARTHTHTQTPHPPPQSA